MGRAASDNAAVSRARAAGNGSVRNESYADVPARADSDLPNNSADRTATVRGGGRNGGPISPTRLDAVPTRDPSTHPNTTTHRRASHGNRAADDGSSAPGYAGY